MVISTLLSSTTKFPLIISEVRFVSPVLITSSTKAPEATKLTLKASSWFPSWLTTRLTLEPPYGLTVIEFPLVVPSVLVPPLYPAPG